MPVRIGCLQIATSGASGDGALSDATRGRCGSGATAGDALRPEGQLVLAGYDEMCDNALGRADGPAYIQD